MMWNCAGSRDAVITQEMSWQTCWPTKEGPHHCGLLVETLLCPLFLPPGFCLFKVTKIVSRDILPKYLRDYLPSKVPSGVPVTYFVTGGQAPPFQPPSRYPSPPTLSSAISCAQNFLQDCLPSKVPSGVPFGYFKTGGQCPSPQSPSRHPSPQTLHKCHIMCPKFSFGLPSYLLGCLLAT